PKCSRCLVCSARSRETRIVFLFASFVIFAVNEKSRVFAACRLGAATYKPIALARPAVDRRCSGVACLACSRSVHTRTNTRTSGERALRLKYHLPVSLEPEAEVEIERHDEAEHSCGE